MFRNLTTQYDLDLNLIGLYRPISLVFWKLFEKYKIISHYQFSLKQQHRENKYVDIINQNFEEKLCSAVFSDIGKNVLIKCGLLFKIKQRSGCWDNSTTHLCNSVLSWEKRFCRINFNGSYSSVRSINSEVA